MNGGDELYLGNRSFNARRDSAASPVISDSDNDTVANTRGHKCWQIFVTTYHLVPEHFCPRRPEIIEEPHDMAALLCF